MYELDEYTVTLLHFDEGIKDETGRGWTAQNGATVSNADSNFGQGSLYLNSEQYLLSANNGDFSFDSGDFTVECWVKRNDYANINQGLFEVVSDNGNAGNPVGYGAFLTLGANFKGLFGFYINNSTSSVAVAGTTVIPVGKWTHIAGVRHNNTLYIFKNGILENSSDCTGVSVNPNSATLVNIGSYANNAWGNAYSGYIDEFRISKIARWTEDFDPKPVKKNCLLRITMNDSSEREYKVTQTEVNSFIEWINGIGRTGDNCYKFADVIDESMEYLIFEKIISFKVIEVS